MIAIIHLLPHLATVPGFWDWLIAGHHWPTAPHGCQWQYGHARGQVLHWVKVCRPSAALRRWPVLIRPTGRG